MKRRICLLLLLALCIMLAGLTPVFSATEDSTVYVRKHVSILFDNSGSMKEKIPGQKNLKWCYASYAAQVFTGLLNDTDSLSLTFMDGTPLKNLDLKGLRQNVVTSVYQRTSTANADTPISQISAALSVLTEEGLKEGLGKNASGEQYWLVLTTDGVFRESSTNLSVERVVSELEAILQRYPDLSLVYFGIGAQNDSSDNKAVDFREGSDVDAALLRRLHSHPNFTAVYAESQEQIVSTMQQLSNRISGRYTVEGVSEVSGEKVTLYLSGEGSPIRNIAVMAQQTDAKLLSAVAEDGKELSVSREAQIRYPRNASYDNVPDDTLGGYVALITGPGGEKIPSGSITLTFSQPIKEDDLLLMYEPAIHINLTVERKNADGTWTVVPGGEALIEGDEIRVAYTVCEDETGKELDTDKLFGKTEAQILFNGEEVRPGQSVTVPSGDSVLNVLVSMMDGGYQIQASRTLHTGLPGPEDFTVTSSGPIELQRKDAAENTEKYIEFTVLFRGAPAEGAYTDKMELKIEGGLDGTVERPEPHIFRFYPKDGDCDAGTYPAVLYYDGGEAAREDIHILPNEVTYTAQVGPELSILSNRVADNTSFVTFTVTAHRDEGDGPISMEEAGRFTVKAASSDGKPLSGQVGAQDGGVITFTPLDPAAVPGSYTVGLWYEDELLAQTSVTILKHDAVYEVETVVSDPDVVQRFALQKNSACIYYIIYEDGVPCEPAQLAAMLNQQIFFSTDLKSPFVKLDVSIGQVNGKPALVCTPRSSTKSGFVRFFHYVAVSCGLGGLARDDFSVSVKVEMLHGAEGTGTLDLAGYNPGYLIALIVILVLLLLLGLLIYSNLRAVRMMKGVLWYFRLEITHTHGAPLYLVSGIDERRVNRGFRFMLAPINEHFQFESIEFGCEARRNRSKWLQRCAPKATIKCTAGELDDYSLMGADPLRGALLSDIRSGVIHELTPGDYNKLVPFWTPLSQDGGGGDREVTVKRDLTSGSYLIRRDANQYRFWCFQAAQAASGSSRRHGRPGNSRRRKR